MNPNGSLLSLISFYLLLLSLHHYQIQGVKTNTEDEDMELEKTLQTLNKPPYQTIKTADGDTIDCIEIYKQPALDHPLLQNHKIRMRPTSLPKGWKSEVLSAQNYTHTSVDQRIANCPEGTVPIRRTQKEDLLRAKDFTQTFWENINPLTHYTPGKHLAIVRSVPDPKIRYYGISASININKPKVEVNQSSSSAQVWIEAGAPSVRNTLQWGWMVAPGLFGDDRTRSFIYWSVKGNNAGGCFNYLCQGFVQVDKSWVLGVPLPVGPYGYKEQFETELFIFKDRATGDWWLRNPVNGINVGYWPKALVPELEGGATQVAWGGQAVGQSYGTSPQMGPGRFPDGAFWHGCYVRQMKVVDKVNVVIEPAGPFYRTEQFVDNTNCYRLIKYGYQPYYFGQSFHFGGPGGNNCGE